MDRARAKTRICFAPNDACGFTEQSAGEGNRTPVCSLGSCRSTIELHPRQNFRFSIFDLRSIRLAALAQDKFCKQRTIIARKSRRPTEPGGLLPFYNDCRRWFPTLCP